MPASGTDRPRGPARRGLASLAAMGRHRPARIAAWANVGKRVGVEQYSGDQYAMNLAIKKTSFSAVSACSTYH